MSTEEKLMWLAVDWFECAQDCGSTTHGFAAQNAWHYLLLWATITSTETPS